jgi:hypothetical protein
MSRIDLALGRLNFGEKKASSDARLRELILYIADKCATDKSYGAIKLNKILFFADFNAYSSREKSITGAEYMGLPQGPVPRHLVAAREQLLEEGAITIRRLPRGRQTQERIIPLREANLDLFSGWEISLVDSIISQCWGVSAREMSRLSHSRIWRLAGTEKGAIPYQAVFISQDNADAHDAARLRKLRARHGHKKVPSAQDIR